MSVKCQNYGCRNKARFKVSSSAGWVGIHCYRHTVGVVKSMLKQAFNGNPIYIQRFYTPDEQKAIDRKFKARHE